MSTDEYNRNTVVEEEEDGEDGVGGGGDREKRAAASPAGSLDKSDNISWPIREITFQQIADLNAAISAAVLI